MRVKTTSTFSSNHTGRGRPVGVAAVYVGHDGRIKCGVSVCHPCQRSVFNRTIGRFYAYQNMMRSARRLLKEDHMTASLPALRKAVRSMVFDLPEQSKALAEFMLMQTVLRLQAMSAEAPQTPEATVVA